MSSLVRCWMCKRDVPEASTICLAGVGTRCHPRCAVEDRTVDNGGHLHATGGYLPGCLLCERVRLTREHQALYRAAEDLAVVINTDPRGLDARPQLEREAFRRLVEQLRATDVQSDSTEKP